MKRSQIDLGVLNKKIEKSRQSLAVAKSKKDRAKVEMDRLYHEKCEARLNQEEAWKKYKAKKGVKSQFDKLLKTYEEVKARFLEAKALYVQAKSEYERELGIFQDLINQRNQIQSDEANHQQRGRIEQTKRYREIAKEKGVPNRFLDKMVVNRKSDGSIHFYYGGQGNPVGNGHGHLVLNSKGDVLYHRFPSTKKPWYCIFS